MKIDTSKIYITPDGEPVRVSFIGYGHDMLQVKPIGRHPSVFTDIHDLRRATMREERDFWKRLCECLWEEMDE